MTQLDYDISTLVPYINWVYFDYAWSMNGKPEEACRQLRADAMKVLQKWDGAYHTHALFGIFDANSDGDDLLLWQEDGQQVRIPMLRQQTPSEPDAPCLCLADFVRPVASGIRDKVGAFAVTVDNIMETLHHDDAYWSMMTQTLADRLAEASAELMHLEVRRNYWGYSPDEQLSIKELHQERFQGIRPAIGYPSLPDTSVNFLLSDLLNMPKIGIRLTENGMMRPHASVSGFMFAHPQARYFNLGVIGDDQLRDYAHRRGIPFMLMRKFINHR